MFRSVIAVVAAFAATPVGAQADCNDDAMLVFDVR